ncbi:MAG: TonB-dependent receptor [Cellvibrio sp. 79]|nr:MAG: TonB-dependent receptor [Cellvibrio sp. 79]
MRNKLSDAIKLANKSALMLGSVAAVAMMGFAGTVNAQDDAAAEPEEIIITGIRGALKNAVDIKRNASAVVDAVSAEDVGKLPDSDVGQALGRIPGITVGRSFGQGASVSIRGADPRMTLTTLNGQTVSSTGWYDQLNIDRSFNYSLLPSELIGGMEVYKSSQANILEGGIGGTVIVKTRKPLELDANTTYIGVKGSTGTVSDDFSPEVSGLYSWKNDEESFGILVSGAWVEGDYVRRGTEADLDWGGRSSIQPSTFIQERERTALDATVQFKPTDEWEFGAHFMSLELSADSIGANMYINTDTDWGDGPSRCQKFNANNICVLSVTSEANASKVFFQNWLRNGDMTSDTYDLNGSYTGEGFSVSAIAGKTKAEGGTEMTSNYGYGWWGDRFSKVKWAGTVDATGKQIKVRPSHDMGFTVNDLDTTVGASTWTGTQGPNSDEETYAQVDFDFDLELGAINKFETGIRSTNHEFEKSEYRAVYNASKTNSFKTADLYSGTMELGYQGWTIPKANRAAMVAANLSLVDHFSYSRPAYGKLEEDNLSLYGMFSFEAEGVRGNFGLRYIETDATSTGHIIDNSPADDLAVNAGWSLKPVSEKDSYSDVLPSVNVSFDLTDELVLRLSASQALNRANYDNMFLSSSSGYPDDRQGNEAITYGGPGLLPMKASQADVGIEYYYGDGNMISLTYFTKDINNFITAETEYEQSIGVVNNDLGVDSWTVNRYVNSGGGEIDGLEFQINHAFGNGFGVVVNYTYANGNAPADVYTDNIGVFTESSQNSANLVGYWENDQFSARAAYNWRSEYMVREYGYYYGNRMHDDFGSLDLSFGWNFTDTIGLTFEATNVLEEDDVQYGAAEAGTTVKPALQDNYPSWSFLGESTYKLGLNVKF